MLYFGRRDVRRSVILDGDELARRCEDQQRTIAAAEETSFRWRDPRYGDRTIDDGWLGKCHKMNGMTFVSRSIICLLMQIEQYFPTGSRYGAEGPPAMSPTVERACPGSRRPAKPEAEDRRRDRAAIRRDRWRPGSPRRRRGGGGRPRPPGGGGGGGGPPPGAVTGGTACRPRRASRASRHWTRPRGCPWRASGSRPSRRRCRPSCATPCPGEPGPC